MGYLGFAVLRFFQAELSDIPTWVNYFITFGVFLIGIGLAGWGAKRTFDEL